MQYGIVKNSLHSLLLTFSAEQCMAATQTYKGGNYCCLFYVDQIR